MEKITTKVNKNIILSEYKNGIRFGTDALLLCHFSGRHNKGVELGSGSGIISFLLLSSGKLKTATGIELSPEYAALSVENAVQNGFDDRFECINCDVNHIKGRYTAGNADCVFSNPPYLSRETGKKNQNALKFIAFHETTADINAFLAAAGYCLKSGGKFYCVYRPEYLSKLFCAMHGVGITPKRLRFVFPSPGKPPSLVLTEGKKHAKDGLIILPPLHIYGDGSHTCFSDEMNDIYTEV